MPALHQTCSAYTRCTHAWPSHVLTLRPHLLTLSICVHPQSTDDLTSGVAYLASSKNFAVVSYEGGMEAI